MRDHLVNRVLLGFPLSILLVSTLGCPANCRYVAEKMFEQCDLQWQQDITIDDYKDQCVLLEEWYEDDPGATEAFDEHLRCLMSTDCSVLEEDETACQDGEIYIGFD
jgi:hypothetical protein